MPVDNPWLFGVRSILYKFELWIVWGWLSNKELVAVNLSSLNEAASNVCLSLMYASPFLRDLLLSINIDLKLSWISGRICHVKQIKPGSRKGFVTPQIVPSCLNEHDHHQSCDACLSLSHFVKLQKNHPCHICPAMDPSSDWNRRQCRASLSQVIQILSS